MRKDHCRECGHLLSKNRDFCPFCGWQECAEERDLWLKMEHELLYPYPEQYRSEMLGAL